MLVSSSITNIQDIWKKLKQRTEIQFALMQADDQIMNTLWEDNEIVSPSVVSDSLRLHGL